MSYELNAVIGSFDLLRSQTAGIRETAVAPLRQRMGLVPVTTQLLEELTGLTDQDGAGPGQPFTVMSPAFEQTLRYWSRGGPIASVEANLHGGDGYQTAAVWRVPARRCGVLPIPGTSPVHGKTGRSMPLSPCSMSFRAAPSGRATTTCSWRWGLAGNRTWTAGSRPAGLLDGRRPTTSGIRSLAEQERTTRAAAEIEKYKRLPDVPVALDGKAIMELLGLPPGPLIGAATRYLQDLHLERGPLSREEAVTLLRTWAAEQDTGCRGR